MVRPLEKPAALVRSPPPSPRALVLLTPRPVLDLLRLPRRQLVSRDLPLRPNIDRRNMINRPPPAPPADAHPQASHQPAPTAPVSAGQPTSRPPFPFRLSAQDCPSHGRGKDFGDGDVHRAAIVAARAVMRPTGLHRECTESTDGQRIGPVGGVGGTDAHDGNRSRMTIRNKLGKSPNKK